MASMSSGIAFPRQFNFGQIANARKLNSSAAASAAANMVEEVSDDAQPAVNTPALKSSSSIGAFSTTAATAPNPFFSRKPSILNSIQESGPALFAGSAAGGGGGGDTPESSSRSSRRSKKSSHRGSSRGGEDSSEADDDDDDYYKRFRIPGADDDDNDRDHDHDRDRDRDRYSDSSSGRSERRSRRSDRSGRSSRSGEHSRSSQPFKDTYDVQMHNKTSVPMTREEYRRKQIDLIMSLRQMKEDGIPVDEDVRLEQSTPLEKLEFAYEYSQRYVIRQSTFNSFQRYLVMGAQLTEVGNKIVKAKTGKGAELDGWSSSVMMNMPQFNYPLQRMAVKYSGSSENSPEMELAMALGWSALSFHMAKKASVDPQVAMQFMSYMQQSRGGGATPGMDPLMSGMPGGPAVGTTAEPTQTSNVASPMGLRPPVASNTRNIPLYNRRTSDDDSDVEESETTEEFRV